VRTLWQKRVCLPRTDSALATRGFHGTGARSACIRPEPVDAKIECVIAWRLSNKKNQDKNVAGERERGGGGQSFDRSTHGAKTESKL
jgi:hypothetical protein